VIFDFAKGLADGLAPARAEDAESELAQKDLLFGGSGRASVVDWALKDHYTASDVSRYSEAALIQARLGINDVALVATNSQVADFNNKVVRDDALRRRKLDNRLEWMIMTAQSTGAIAYNDGKVKFTVDYARPAGQHNQAPPGGLWTVTTSDPIGDILSMQDFMYDTYGVRMTRAITSRKVLNSVMKSDKFIARSGLITTPTGTKVDLNYVMDGWGPQAAVQVLSNHTGVTFTEYDAVYRTRPIGSATFTNNRFFPQNTILFMPAEEDINAIDDTPLGYGRTLSSPHPEGNWQSGYYEWEESTKDPWGVNRGTGVKAFPVFPHMDLSFTMVVIP
jgi:Phage major capsid protein E